MMVKFNLSTDSLGVQKTCPQCGKEFLVHSMNSHAYTTSDNSVKKYFCSYSCVNKYREEHKSSSQRKKEAKIQRELKGM